jgi:hypothetical protein
MRIHRVLGLALLTTACGSGSSPPHVAATEVPVERVLVPDTASADPPTRVCAPPVATDMTVDVIPLDRPLVPDNGGAPYTHWILVVGREWPARAIPARMSIVASGQTEHVMMVDANGGLRGYLTKAPPRGVCVRVGWAGQPDVGVPY